MRGAGLLLAGALVLATNAFVLGGVAYNRRGTPEAQVVLTERELRLGYGEKENSGMWVRLDFMNGWADRPSWFDRKKLEELGFDCRLPVSDEAAPLHYDKMLPLRRYAVLEFDGDAWKRWIARREEEILRPETPDVTQTPEERQERFETERAGHSRLFLIDVGRDAADLRQRYPDRSRTMVVEAIVRLSLRRTWDEEKKAFKEPTLEGDVSEVLITSIHVPRGQRGILEIIRREQTTRKNPNIWDPYGFYSPYLENPPRYQVTVNYGRRLEPWIDDIRSLAAGAAQPR